jgi:NADH dehydrogenase FAD-containing subunit
VLVIGGGFAGLYAAKALSNKAVEVTLIDRKNHHTFQPLLYQVALAVLSPGEIASSLRHILRRSRNVQIILGEVTGFDTTARRVKLSDGAELDYDYLIWTSPLLAVGRRAWNWRAQLPTSRGWPWPRISKRLTRRKHVSGFMKAPHAFSERFRKNRPGEPNSNCRSWESKFTPAVW